MRLGTFNLLHGASLADGRVEPARLVEACLSLGATVLGLQEIDRGQERSGGADQTAAVAEAMGLDGSGWRFEPALFGEPGGKWRAASAGDASREPAYGVGLISRLPVRRWHSIRLPAAPVRSPVVVPGPGPRRLMWPRDEPRVAVAALVMGEQGPILVATTHLSFVPGWNLVQLRRLVASLGALVRDEPVPCILLGDLNMPAPVPSVVTRWRSLARRPTWPTMRPAIQIDHILARGPVGEVVAVDSPRLGISDHRALVVDLAKG
ncbi:MAG: endonuclease/exonuclease/phosphatase family protein [Acidimicrobiales bacterium]